MFSFSCMQCRQRLFLRDRGPYYKQPTFSDYEAADEILMKHKLIWFLAVHKNAPSYILHVVPSACIWATVTYNADFLYTRPTCSLSLRHIKGIIVHRVVQPSALIAYKQLQAFEHWAPAYSKTHAQTCDVTHFRQRSIGPTLKIVLRYT